MKRASVAFAIALTLCCACRNKPHRPAIADGPREKPVVTWTENKGEIGPGGAYGKIESHVFSLDDTVRFKDLPERTKVKVGDKEATANQFGEVGIDAPIGAVIAPLAPKDAFDRQFKVDPKLSIVVTYPNGIEVATAAPPVDVQFGIREALKALKDKPVLFGDEPPGSPAKHTVLFMTGLSPEVLGAAATMHDVDWVAVSTDLPGRPGKTCSGYKDKNGNPTVSLPLEMVDEEVSIIERKTAKGVATKKFVAEEHCPFMAFGDKATSSPDSDAIKSWLREQRDKR